MAMFTLETKDSEKTKLCAKGPRERDRKIASLRKSKSVTVRTALPSDIPAIWALIQPMYQIRRPIDFYQWLFFQNVDPTPLLCAFDEDELIGTFAIQRRRLTNQAVCGQEVGINVASHWQGKGLFSLLGETAVRRSQDFDLFCVFANAAGKVSCERSLGFHTLGLIETMALDVSKLGEEELTCTVEKIDGTCSLGPFHYPSAKISFETSNRYRLWRYAENPVYRYHRVQLETGEFAVVKTFADPMSGTLYGDIVDFEADQNREEKLRDLFLQASLFLKELGAEWVTTWALQGTASRAAIIGLGFKAEQRDTYFSIKVMNPLYNHLLDFSQWYLRQSDATNY